MVHNELKGDEAGQSPQPDKEDNKPCNTKRKSGQKFNLKNNRNLMEEAIGLGKRRSHCSTFRTDSRVSSHPIRNVGCQGFRSKEEEYRSIDDLIGFDNLKTMFEAEDIRRRRKGTLKMHQKSFL
ncbi:unnamed protein product [Dovyalis caffra]|uniref:Uncharacterized protein n=1 Tax=Dovyalis caffra TaxID=77055 RepID=A0AAV1QSR4_9ROSI|nr:unnamed protein product [Dovyalis caffra]